MGKYLKKADVAQYTITAADVSNGLNFAGKLVVDGTRVGMINSVALPSEAANGGAAEGDIVEIYIRDIVEHKKATAATWSRGGTVYLDVAGKEITDDSSGNLVAGIAESDATAVDGEYPFQLAPYVAPAT